MLSCARHISVTTSVFFALAALAVPGCAADDDDGAAPDSTEDGTSSEDALTGARTVRPTTRLLNAGDPARRVLVVLSAADAIALIPDATHATDKYVTGVFARELTEPLKVLAQKGYSFDFATPNGVAPTWDINGLELGWFFWGDSAHTVGDRVLIDALGAGRTRDEGVSLLMEAFGSLRMSQKPTLTLLELPSALKRWKRWEEAEHMQPLAPKSLAEVAGAMAAAGSSSSTTSTTSPYVGLLIPGGHAPMTDLAFDPNMATIVRHFHDAKKPIAVVCHGPVALMSTTGKTSVSGWRAMTDAERAAWPYHGYTITIESTAEEKIMEKVFAKGQKVTYYVDAEMERAGATLARAQPEHIPGLAKVSADRELISGQSPASANCVGQVLAESIELTRRQPNSEWWTARTPVSCDGQ